MAFTEDPCELIAADMLAWLSDAARDFDEDLELTESEVFSIPEHPSYDELKREVATAKVLLVPSGDAETKYTRSTRVEATHLVTVIVKMPTTPAMITRRKMNGFVYAIKKSLRGVRMAGYVWAGNQAATKYDPEQLRTRAQYLAAFQAEYFGIE